MPMGFRPVDKDAWTFSLMIADMAASLTKTCNIQRKSNALGPSGAPSKTGGTYADLYTNVPCRLRTVRRYPQADVVMVAGQMTQIQALLLLVPLTTDLRAEDQVVIGGQGYIVLGDESIIPTKVALTALVRHVGAMS